MRLDASVTMPNNTVPPIHHKIIAKNPSSHRNRHEKPLICSTIIDIIDWQSEKWLNL